jgi:uroporphyrin-III C-methyltransferase
VLSPATPAAVVQWAGSANERRVTGALGTIAALARDAGLGSPAIILVGEAIGEALAFAPRQADVAALNAAATLPQLRRA